MGRWRQETDLYGERERWIPDFRGEWPADDSHLAGVMEGNVPSPCPTCSGELVRRVKSPDAKRLARELERRARVTESLVEAGKDAPVFDPQAPPTRIRLYDVACYRGPHGFETLAQTRAGKPSTVGEVLELAPATRTGDWRDR